MLRPTPMAYPLCIATSNIILPICAGWVILSCVICGSTDAAMFRFSSHNYTSIAEGGIAS